jgi:hypothetical protein
MEVVWKIACIKTRAVRGSEAGEGSEGLSESDWTIIGRTEASGGEAFGE